MLGLFLKILLTTWSFFFQFPRTRTKSHLESHMESHLLLAVCSLETTQNQVKDQSKQIERLISLFNDQSQQLNDQSQQLNNQSQQLNDQLQQLNNQSQQLNNQSQQLNDQLQQLNDQSQQLNNQSQQLNDQLKQLNDQSQQLNNQSQQIKGLVAKNTEQSQEIASLTSSMQGLVQQVERLTGQDRHQAVLVDKPTDQTKGMKNKIEANNDKVEEGKFLKKLRRCVNGGIVRYLGFIN